MNKTIILSIIALSLCGCKSASKPYSNYMEAEAPGYPLHLTENQKRLLELNQLEGY